MAKLTVKTLLVRNIVHQQNTHRASIVCRRNCPKALLPRRIPYLQLYPLAV